MNWRLYIETNTNVLSGKPVIKGTRLSVEYTINLLASGWSEIKILENYPWLSKESVQAVFLYIQDIIQHGLIYEKSLKTTKQNNG